jgi:hypothetical protein
MPNAATATGGKPTSPVKSARKGSGIARPSARVKDAISIAEGKGLLAGGRTLMIRGRMPEALVAQARRKTGIKSDSKLIEAALATIAVADDYAEWLIAHRGTVNPDLDLEF